MTEAIHDPTSDPWYKPMPISLWMERMGKTRIPKCNSENYYIYCHECPFKPRCSSIHPEAQSRYFYTETKKKMNLEMI